MRQPVLRLTREPVAPLTPQDALTRGRQAADQGAATGPLPITITS